MTLSGINLFNSSSKAQVLPTNSTSQKQFNFTDTSFVPATDLTIGGLSNDYLVNSPQQANPQMKAVAYSLPIKITSASKPPSRAESRKSLLKGLALLLTPIMAAGALYAKGSQVLRRQVKEIMGHPRHIDGLDELSNNHKFNISSKGKFLAAIALPNLSQEKEKRPSVLLLSGENSYADHENPHEATEILSGKAQPLLMKKGTSRVPLLSEHVFRVNSQGKISFPDIFPVIKEGFLSFFREPKLLENAKDMKTIKGQLTAASVSPGPIRVYNGGMNFVDWFWLSTLIPRFHQHDHEPSVNLILQTTDSIT